MKTQLKIMNIFNRIVLMFLIFYSSSLMAKITCEVLDYKECKVSDNGELICSNEIYPKLSRGHLDFKDPPIKFINIYSHIEGYGRTSVSRKDFDGYLIFESLEKYSEDYYNNLFAYKHDRVDKKLNIYKILYGGLTKLKKILSIHDPFYNTFLLTESFYVNSNLISRSSSGKCYD